MNGLLRIEKFINQKNIMSKVSVLIIGAGNISLQHLNSLITLKDIKLYGILSRTKIKSVKISKQFKIPHVLNSYEEIDYHITNIDLMMICVDSDQTIKVFNKIKKYKKFIFFEKPIGINLKESKIIFKEVQKYNLKTFVGFNRRYYSILNKGLSKLKRNGKKIVSVNIEGNERIWQVKKNPKHFKNIQYWPFINSIHTTDLIRYISGDIKFETFKSIKSKYSFFASMFSKKNILVNYVSNYDYYDGWSVKIYNDNGEFIILKPLESCSLINHNSILAIKPHRDDIAFKPGFKIMHRAMISAYKSDEKVSINYNVEDALKSVYLTERIFY